MISHEDFNAALKQLNRWCVSRGCTNMRELRDEVSIVRAYVYQLEEALSTAITQYSLLRLERGEPTTQEES